MLIRKALATAGLLGGLSLGVLGMGSTASAATPAPAAVIAAQDGDPVEGDGNNDSGKWGLAGLTGLVGLFGYKKYREIQTRNRDVGGPDSPSGSTRR